MNGLSKAISNFIEFALIGIVIFLIAFCNGKVVNLIKQFFTCAARVHNIGVRENKLVHAPVKDLIHNGSAVGAYFCTRAHFF